MPVSPDIVERANESRAKRAAGWKHGDPWPQEDAAPAPEGVAVADSHAPDTDEAGGESGEATRGPGTESREEAASGVPAPAAREMSPEVGPGPANGTRAAGGNPEIPDFGDYPAPKGADRPGVEVDRAVQEMKTAAAEEFDRICRGAMTSIDLIEKAVARTLEQVDKKVPSIDSREIAILVNATEKFEEYFRTVRADETRRRDVAAARRRYKWPVRGLVAAGVAALLFAGAAGEARWGLVQDYGAVDPATDAWRTIVWEEHGLKIARCMKTARDRGPGTVCSVAARLK